MRHSLIVIGLLSLLLAACEATTNGQSDLAPQSDTGTIMQRSSSGASPAVQSGSSALQERLLSGGILEIGDAHAPASLTLFINYASVYSQQFDQNLLPQLIRDFVETGKVRVGIVPLPFKKYPDSGTSAALLLCAAKQGRGMAMNDLLFGNASAADLQKKIGDIGLDIPSLQSCMKSDDLQAMLGQEAQLAGAYNITLVPSYLLGGHVYTGLPQYADLKGQAEEALKY